MTVRTIRGNALHLYGLSIDVKPVDNIPDGSGFYETDTGEFWFLDVDTWVLKSSGNPLNLDVKLSTLTVKQDAQTSALNDVLSQLQGGGSGAAPVKLTGSYVEYNVVQDATILANATASYNVDIVANLGIVRVLGVSTSITNAENAVITAKAIAVPKNYTGTQFNASSITQTFANTINMKVNDPLTSVLSYIPPRFVITVMAGATNLTGVTIDLWGYTGV